MRKIRVYQAAENVKTKEIKGSIAVVADVLRATSTIVTALYNGCRIVIPVITVDDAYETARSFDGKELMLGGERNGQKIDGFDFGNSPQEYTREKVKEKILITTTTNGTKALVRTAEAEETLVLSFLNLTAVGDYILKRQNDITAVAAGLLGDFSIEDSVCCGLLIEYLLSRAPDQFEKTAALEKILHMSRMYSGKIEQLLSESTHGSYLRSIGYESDLKVCARTDSCSIVPRYSGGTITIT